jgi:predicted GNAT family acetyltransferase
MDKKVEVEVHREDAQHAYLARIEGETAVISYEEAGPGVLDFQHTKVPEAMQGQGVGEELVHQALDDVRARGLKVIPTCPFVSAYIRRHRQYQDLVAQG